MHARSDASIKFYSVTEGLLCPASLNANSPLPPSSRTWGTVGQAQRGSAGQQDPPIFTPVCWRSGIFSSIMLCAARGTHKVKDVKELGKFPCQITPMPITCRAKQYPREMVATCFGCINVITFVSKCTTHGTRTDGIDASWKSIRDTVASSFRHLISWLEGPAKTVPDTHPGVANAMAVGICLANEGCSFPRSTTRSLIRQGNILTWKCPAVLKTPCAFRALITCVVSVCSVWHAYDYIYVFFAVFICKWTHRYLYI